MQARVTQTLRMFCRSPSILAKSSPTFPRSFLTRHGAQRHAFITTRAKKPYNPKPPRHNKSHGDDIRTNRRARKRAPKFHVKRREALPFTVLSHLKREEATKVSSQRQSDESTVEQELPPASTTAKLHDVLDRHGNGFIPEEWSSGWGNDGMSVDQLQCWQQLSEWEALAPSTSTQDTSSTFRRRLPPHVRCQMHTRRTEGSIDDAAASGDSTPLLQG